MKGSVGLLYFSQRGDFEESKSIHTMRDYHPTEPVTIFEPHIPSNDISYLHKVLQPSDFEALRILLNGPSGTTTTHVWQTIGFQRRSVFSNLEFSKKLPFARTHFRPTSPFPISEPQNPWIHEFCVVRESRGTDFKAVKEFVGRA